MGLVSETMRLITPVEQALALNDTKDVVQRGVSGRSGRKASSRSQINNPGQNETTGPAKKGLAPHRLVRAYFSLIELDNNIVSTILRRWREL